MKLTALRFLNIVSVALLAGTSFGIWIGFNPKNYAYPTYVEQQQHLVRALHTLMVALVVASTIITIISAFQQRQNRPVFFTLLAAAAFLASCIFISRFGNLPIQTEMLQWNTETVPANWTELRDSWWNLHIARTIVELIALALVAWASARD